MFDADAWYEIYHNLSKHKLRTFLTSFGVFWGIFMLVLLLGAGKGFENGVMRIFGGYATKTLFVWGGQTRVAHKGLKPGRFIQFNNEDTKRLSSLRGIDAVSPRIDLWGENTISYKTKNNVFGVRGCTSDQTKMEQITILDGRFINPLDVKEQKKVAVIGIRVQEVFFAGGSTLGQYITIKGVQFKVIGVFKTNKNNWNSKSDMEAIWIPISTLQVTFNQLNNVSWYGVLVSNSVPAEAAKKDIQGYFKDKYNIAESDDQAIGIANMEEEFKKFQGLFNGINLFVWVVGIGTIISGIVGVGNIMMITVKERTREIGLRKALGATPFQIVSMIVQESIIITSISGYLGLLLGASMLEGLNYSMQKFDLKNDFFHNPGIDFNIAITAILLLILTGALAGLLPAVKAASVHPIEALRDE